MREGENLVIVYQVIIVCLFVWSVVSAMRLRFKAAAIIALIAILMTVVPVAILGYYIR